MNRLRKVAVSALLLFASMLSAQTGSPPPNLTFTTIDFPGAGFSYINGINSAGDMVGNYGTIDNGETGFAAG